MSADKNLLMRGEVKLLVLLFCVTAYTGAFAVSEERQLSKPLASDGSTPAQQLQVLGAKGTAKEERLRALHQLFQGKQALTKTERLQFWNQTTALAQDRTEDAQLRADTIWVVGGLGMHLKHEKELSHENISKQCRFLLESAADETEAPQVRRISITVLGNLQMKEAVPVVKKLLAEKANHNRPEIARSACITLSELAPDEALQPVGEVLSGTTNAAIFGSAAYSLGRLRSVDALPILVSNRARLGDNLSVDNALQEMSALVLEVLKNPTDPHIDAAIKATRSLWRDEQKAEFKPFLERILADRANPVGVRREALLRLIDDAYLLPIESAKLRLSDIVALIEEEATFDEERARIQQILNAKPVQPMEVKP